MRRFFRTSTWCWSGNWVPLVSQLQREQRAGLLRPVVTLLKVVLFTPLDESRVSWDSSRVRALHRLQHRLGSGGHREGARQQSQRPFVGQGCPEALFHHGSLEFYRHGYRESQEVPLPLPGILGSLRPNPLQPRRKENLQPPASNPLVPYLSFQRLHLFPSPALGWPSRVRLAPLLLLAF